ncbi:MAG: rhodanese-like domain-containing protein [Acidimicrobiia bacterium]|nr:rhodanese-like domain-containing protein [Acidimicrobiia bacterium]
MRIREKVGGRWDGPGWVLPLIVGGALVVVVAVVIALTGNGSSGGLAAATTLDEHGADGIPYPAVARVGVDEAYAMAENGNAVIVDVRESSEYEEAHVVGSLSLPEAELGARMGELPTGQLIVTYCT